MTPIKVKQAFKERLEKAIELHDGLVMTAQRWRNRAATETMLAEQFCMYASVQWESFLSDLFTSYALEDPSIALKNLEKRLTESIRSKFGERALRCVSYDFDGPFTWERLSAVLDPNDWNITVKSAEGLSARANELLVAKHAKLFSLDKADSQFLNYSIALRNYLGHRSAGSRRQLVVSLKNLTEPGNASFLGTVTNVGAYLKGAAGSTSRAVAFAKRLLVMAQKL